MKLEVIRVIDDEGRVVHPEREPKLTGDELRRLFRAICSSAHPGRAHAAAAAPGADRLLPVVPSARRRRPSARRTPFATSDWIYPAYRETGAALYRGYPLRTFMCQLFGNAEDPVKGRQMPVHHSVRQLNFVSISSPVGTQIPHAVGAAWAREAPEEGRRRGRLLRRGGDVDADLPRQHATSPRCSRSRSSSCAATTAGRSRCRARCRPRRAPSRRRRSPTACPACWSTATTSWR